MKIILSIFLTVPSLALAQFASSPSLEPTAEEQALGPWLNLQGGGIAVGPAQTIVVSNTDGAKNNIYGALLNGSLLPAKGDSYARVSDASTSWGTGMMISLIENASAEMNRTYYPGNMVYVGDIAMEHGGMYAPHKSHQSGLDADILFMGSKSYTSVVDENGNVTSKFDAEKNWQFWRLITAQQILENGKPTSVISMILVAPEIKKYLCGWAKEKNLFENPLDVEILRKLRPTVGHDDHMHIRLKCSPYYPDCKKQGANTDIGCE